MTGIVQLSFDAVLSIFTEKKIIRICIGKTHPLQNQITFSTSSGRLTLIRTRTERYKRSFLPRAVKLLSVKDVRKGDRLISEL